MKWVFVVYALLGFMGHARAIDREAFTITNYDLTLQVEPEQHRLGVRGHLTLRNDSSTPQKNAVLQISSSLNWVSIRIEKEPVQFVAQTYTSDIDHTGALSEAIVSLPQAVPPKGTVDLDIGYEGIIPLDTTRLTRIGVPEDQAKHTDWDQISNAFTAVRGIGYVAWYPVATESASLSEEDSVARTIGRWQKRESDAKMALQINSTLDEPALFTGMPTSLASSNSKETMKMSSFNTDSLEWNVPTFVIGNYQTLSTTKISNSIHYLTGHEETAHSLETEIAGIENLNMFVGLKENAASLQVIENSDPAAAPFSTMQMLIMPFDTSSAMPSELTLVYALALQEVHTPRAWIREGLAHYAQAFYLEQLKGRQAALDYLNAHNALLISAEQRANDTTGETANRNSLVNAPNNIYLQSKALNVFWMLHDMIGASSNLSAVLLNYKYSEDHSPDYLEKVLEKNAQRDLKWFFDDWVYNDRGLPDFHVDSVYVSEIPHHGYLVTITVENSGYAGAEVPVRARMAQGEVVKRLIVQGKSKASIRMEMPMIPQEIVVNDGSVPESNMNNNVYKVPSTAVQPASSAP